MPALHVALAQQFVGEDWTHALHYWGLVLWFVLTRSSVVDADYIFAHEGSADLLKHLMIVGWGRLKGQCYW